MQAPTCGHGLRPTLTRLALTLHERAIVVPHHAARNPCGLDKGIDGRGHDEHGYRVASAGFYECSGLPMSMSFVIPI
jgi:hypothetical protein